MYYRILTNGSTFKVEKSKRKFFFPDWKSVKRNVFSSDKGGFCSYSFCHTLQEAEATVMDDIRHSIRIGKKERWTVLKVLTSSFFST